MPRRATYLVRHRRGQTGGASFATRWKLTQLGLDVDRATAVDNLRRILDHARTFHLHRHGEFGMPRR